MRNILFILLLTLFYIFPSYAFDVSLKIIGGNEVKDNNSYPWMVALLHKEINDNFYAQFCGGTYIGNGWILTAAHCFYDNERNVRIIFPENLDILYGTTSLKSGGNRVGVKKIYIHEKYNHLIHTNDIALIKLITAPNIPKIEILKNDNYFYASPGNISIIMGWGDTAPGEDTSFADNLMEAKIPIVSNETCANSYGSLIKSFNICAGYKKGGIDTCQGDSGGPLVVENESKSYMLAGIVSWARDCALPEYYGVNTRITQYEDWITYIINSDNTTDYKSIVMPDSDTLSIYIKDGSYIDIFRTSSYKLESCSEKINQVNTSMLKLTQEFIIQENKNSVEVSIIYPESNDSDEYYIKDSSGEYIYANDIIEKNYHKVIYTVLDNSNLDLNDEIGKIKTILVKTNTFFSELKSNDNLSCFEQSITETPDDSHNSSGGSGCSAGNASIVSWIIVMLLFIIQKIFFKKIKN
jgi:V8-like Glu-specific endopeptidase